jgi:hypothetical protein
VSENGRLPAERDPWEVALRDAVEKGFIDPAKSLPMEGDAVREWARFTVALDDVDRELSIARKLAVIEPLYPGNARELLLAALGEAERERAGDGREARRFIDWPTFWRDEQDGAEWVYPDVLARGRGHALYAGRKEGKSLLALYMAAKLASEGSCHVLYVDYEMTEQDLRERLRDMGYGPASELSRLHYALLPTLPPLDSEAGGAALMGLLDSAAADAAKAHFVVIIDTIGRAVQGEENSADTWRLFYLHTGLRLKQRGLTWMRLDHAGHEATHQRGSSAKGDDVDIVWRLKRTDNGVVLKRELARMAWVPETVPLLQEDFPLRYLPGAADWPAGTAEVANILDRLGLPLEASVRTAGMELRKVDEGRRHELVSAALKWRREKAADQFRPRGEHRGEHPSEGVRGTPSEEDGEQAPLSLGNAAGNTGEQRPRVGGEQSPPLRRGTVPPPLPDPLRQTSGVDDGFDL